MKHLRFNILAPIDALVLITCCILLFASLDQSGDASTGLFFLLTLLFLFISLPLFMSTAIAVFIISPITKIRISYLALSLVAHLGLAHGMGFFDKAIDSIDRQQTIKANPALHQLRFEMNRSNQRDVSKIAQALAEGADPDASLVEGIDLPVLLLATINNDSEAVKTLLEAGANPNIRSTVEVKEKSNPSALDIVLLGDGDDNAAFDTLDLLLDAGANIENSLLALGACYRGSIDIYLNARSMSANTDQDLNGNSCMHYAVMNNQIGFLQTVFSAANDYPEIVRHLNLSNSRNIRPLNIAEREDLTEMEDFLLSIGANAQ